VKQVRRDDAGRGIEEESRKEEEGRSITVCMGQTPTNPWVIRTSAEEGKGMFDGCEVVSEERLAPCESPGEWRQRVPDLTRMLLRLQG
jgi:hypothetical protein